MTAYLLNILDLLFTLHALSHGGIELNPLMQSVPFMIFCKVFLVGALCFMLDRLARKGYYTAQLGLYLCAVFFAVIDAWHLANLVQIKWIGG